MGKRGDSSCPLRNRSQPPVVRKAKDKSRVEAKRKGVNCLIVFFRRLRWMGTDSISDLAKRELIVLAEKGKNL